MNKYERYKKVDLPWLEEVPEHWAVAPISHVFEERKEINQNGDIKFILSVMKNRGVIPYTEKGNVGNKASENIESYKIVYPNDMVFNSMNMMIGSLGKSKYKGVLSQVYYVLRLINESEHNIDYLNYLFQVKPFYESFRVLGKGILDHRLRVPMQMLKYEKVILPPLLEQRQIAAYLDWKINEIDRLIAVEKEKTAQLKIYKQKFIDNAINNLVDPFIPLREIFSFGKGLSITKENLGENGIRCISYGEIHRGFRFSFISNDKRLKGLEKSDDVSISKSAILEQGDFIFADTSEDLIGCGNFSFLEEKNTEVYAGYHTIVGKRKQNFNSKYLAYYFESETWREQVRKQVKGIKVFSITQSILKATKVQIPNLEQQFDMVITLDSITEKTENLLRSIQLNISNLESLKHSLISEVVTGKIDVRNVVIPSYEKVGISVSTGEEEIEE
ncbi:restriction endonuclease subunit S [Streptococcus oralis]|uniref:restriction endonuclease subunit S n=1 Tax=Streptococcus oralis TaxID=1303 RepID=UPI001119F327|nr:restriction endonuclease subunit S [Streptococcus oralis]